jgi:hypothetical protein
MRQPWWFPVDCTGYPVFARAKGVVRRFCPFFIIIRISNQNCLYAVLICRLRRKRCFALPLEMLRSAA